MDRFRANNSIRVCRAEMTRRLRESLNICQAVFAAYLNASISTVQKWENGDKKPSGAATHLLSVIERKGLEVPV